MSVCCMHNHTSEENNHRQVCIAAIMMNGDREGAEAEGGGCRSGGGRVQGRRGEGEEAEGGR